MTITTTESLPTTFAASRNACKLCAPLGACLAFAGIEGARTVLHGSQGCATYIRRYMISHFKEPIDIASSNFAESATIFGGGENLRASLLNVAQQYAPELIGIATTCLAETIGEDVAHHLRGITADPVNRSLLPALVHVATPSYCGTHADGYVATLRAIVTQLAEHGARGQHVNLFPSMFSPADLRYLREIADDMQLPVTLLPDYSDTLDGPIWSEYYLTPAGGTSLQAVRSTGQARASIEFSFVQPARSTAGGLLSERFGVPNHCLGLPIGVRHTDTFFGLLESLANRPTPRKHTQERGRLIDSLADGHKYVFGRRAIVYGDEDLVIGLADFLAEIGMLPVLCASGGESGRMRAAWVSLRPEMASRTEVCEAADFADIEQRAAALRPDIVIGSSKGYGFARRLNVPLVRVGFPIHDRVGGARVLHVGYRGAQQLFDRITNALIERDQDQSDVGYAYM